LKSFFLRIAIRIKKWINFLLDRISSLCNFLIIWSGVFPAVIRDAIRGFAYFLGNLALFVEGIPRMDAYWLKGKEWTIVFVGYPIGFKTVLNLFFENQEVTTQILERVFVWRLPKQTKVWLSAGADLVICELSQTFPWKPSAAYSFSGPDWVMQVLDLPASPEDLLVGRRIHGPRRRIRQAEKMGFGHRFTRSLDDFHYFYSEMYLPFIRARHGEQASICPMSDQLRRWFKLGGLVLVTQNDQPVAGTLVIRTGKLCHGIEMGVLHNDAELFNLGVIALIQWSTILWSHSQGAKQLNLGGSHAWCSNGSFDFKAQWGARVVKWDKPTLHWYFHSNHLPASLLAKLNQIGYISEHQGKFYYTYIPTEASENLEEKLLEASMHGLSGVALVQDGSTEYLMEAVTSK
jgi:hypothetical protein